MSPSPTVADSEVADLSQTSLKTTQIVPRNAYGNAFFTLLIRATKPKHATTKLLPTPSVAHATEECDLPCAVVTSADSRDGLDHMDPAELKLMQDNEKPAKQNPNSKTPRDELRAVADSFSFEHIPYTWDHPVFPQVEGFVPDATLPDCIPYPLLSLLGRVPAEYTTVDLDKKSSSERPEWTESSRLEGKPAFMTLEDFRRAVHQLECETDHSMIGSQDFAAETFLDPAYHDHSVLDRNAAFVDSQEEFPADLCFSEWDEQYLDGIDARLADLAEQANLHSIDQAIMSLHRM